MGRTASTIGMMEGAFFVSRTDLLQWVNSMCQVNLTKVEQCASGAIYCQIIDACHPGSVAMRRVNWMAKADHEFIPNYKVLQAAFDRNSIERHIDVDKLIRAKYQDNLEFLQWMKCYWEREGSGRTDYDPVQAREGKPVPPWARAAGGGACIIRERPVEKENLRPRPSARGEPGANMARSPPARPTGAKTVPGSARAPSRSANTSLEADCNLQADIDALQKVNEEFKTKVAAQQEELQEHRATLDGLERERDYYFTKLRDIEILCATLQAQMTPGLTAEALITDIQGILYSEKEEENAQEDS